MNSEPENIVSTELVKHPYLAARLADLKDMIKSDSLRTRIFKSFDNEKIKYVAELVIKSENEILRMPNMGQACLEALNNDLVSPCGLHFNYEIEEYTKQPWQTADNWLRTALLQAEQFRTKAGIQVGESYSPDKVIDPALEQATVLGFKEAGELIGQAASLLHLPEYRAALTALNKQYKPG